MRRVNSWQLAHPVMKPDDRNWKRATWYTGVVAAWIATGDKSFLRQHWLGASSTIGKLALSQTAPIGYFVFKPGWNCIFATREIPQ